MLAYPFSTVLVHHPLDRGLVCRSCLQSCAMLAVFQGRAMLAIPELRHASILQHGFAVHHRLDNRLQDGFAVHRRARLPWAPPLWFSAPRCCSGCYSCSAPPKLPRVHVMRLQSFHGSFILKLPMVRAMLFQNCAL